MNYTAWALLACALPVTGDLPPTASREPPVSAVPTMFRVDPECEVSAFLRCSGHGLTWDEVAQFESLLSEAELFPWPFAEFQASVAASFTVDSETVQVAATTVANEDVVLVHRSSWTPCDWRVVHGQEHAESALQLLRAARDASGGDRWTVPPVERPKLILEGAQ